MSAASRMRYPVAGWTLGLLCLLPAAAGAQTKVFRCTIDGQVTFQQHACPANSAADQLQVRPGNVASSPIRPAPAVAPAPSAPAASAPPSPPAAERPTSALDDEAARCLEHLRPFLRDPRSAYITAPRREGRVLFLDLHAANASGGIVLRPAACEFFNGLIESGWTRIQLQRLGWFRPPVHFSGPRARLEAERQALDDIEVPSR